MTHFRLKCFWSSKALQIYLFWTFRWRNVVRFKRIIVILWKQVKGLFFGFRKCHKHRTNIIATSPWHHSLQTKTKRYLMDEVELVNRNLQVSGIYFWCKLNMNDSDPELGFDSCDAIKLQTKKCNVRSNVPCNAVSSKRWIYILSFLAKVYSQNIYLSHTVTSVGEMHSSVQSEGSFSCWCGNDYRTVTALTRRRSIFWARWRSGDPRWGCLCSAGMWCDVL